MTGQAADTDCADCPAGYYCPYLGATTTIIGSSTGDSTHKCNEGYICHGKSIKPYGNDGTIASACSAGSKCDRGDTTETPCPVGSYNPHTASGSCYPCPAGKV